MAQSIVPGRGVPAEEKERGKQTAGGRLAAKAIMAVMPEGYRVENKPPPRGKDVNDFLCHRLGIPIRGSHGKEPER